MQRSYAPLPLSVTFLPKGTFVARHAPTIISLSCQSPPSFATHRHALLLTAHALRLCAPNCRTLWSPPAARRDEGRCAVPLRAASSHHYPPVPPSPSHCRERLQFCRHFSPSSPPSPPTSAIRVPCLVRLCAWKASSMRHLMKYRDATAGAFLTRRGPAELDAVRPESSPTAFAFAKRGRRANRPPVSSVAAPAERSEAHQQPWEASRYRC